MISSTSLQTILQIMAHQTTSNTIRKTSHTFYNSRKDISYHFGPVFQQHVPFIMGKGARTLKMIKKQTGGYVQVMQPDQFHPFPWFLVRGGMKSVFNAVARLEQIRDEAARRMPIQQPQQPQQPQQLQRQQSFYPNPNTIPLQPRAKEFVQQIGNNSQVGRTSSVSEGYFPAEEYVPRSPDYSPKNDDEPHYSAEDPQYSEEPHYSAEDPQYSNEEPNYSPPGHDEGAHESKKKIIKKKNNAQASN